MAIVVDGPYVMYLPDNKINIVSVDSAGEVKNRAFTGFPDDLVLDVFSEDLKVRFQVKLHPFQRSPWSYPPKEKNLVISDPHGDIHSFISVLQSNGVIDEEFRWSFENNQLTISGDIFDKGRDVLPIFWLVYKLEYEAEQAGGKVSFLLGNHEEMVLRNSNRYTDKKYKRLARKLHLRYNMLWDENSELGRWLRTKNSIEKCGEDIFVHAGFSPLFIQKNLPSDQVNRLISKGLSFTKNKRKGLSPDTEWLFSSKGPLWYRGMVNPGKKYPPISETEIDTLLARFNAARIIVGHTVKDDITSLHHNRVIAINVNNKKNLETHKGRGLLILNRQFYIIFDSRKPEKILNE